MKTRKKIIGIMVIQLLAVTGCYEDEPELKAHAVAKAVGSPCLVDWQCEGISKCRPIINMGFGVCSQNRPPETLCNFDYECLSNRCVLTGHANDMVCGGETPDGESCVHDRECASNICQWWEKAEISLCRVPLGKQVMEPPRDNRPICTTGNLLEIDLLLSTPENLVFTCKEVICTVDTDCHDGMICRNGSCIEVEGE